MKPLRKYVMVPLLVGVFLLAGASRMAAQLSVASQGLAVQTFDAAPPVSQWSTLSVGPVVTGGVISSGAQLDNAVQTNAAARVSAALPTSSAVPPAASGNAQWNSTGHYLQTRANGNWYTLLMASLRNDTGSNIAFLSINYDLAALVAAGASIVEEVPGHRVYYSFTGGTGTWVHIPLFDSPASTNAGPKNASIALGAWAPNAPLYLLWADANSSAPFSGANQEGGYTIDSFAVTAQPPSEGPPVILNQPVSHTVGFPNVVTFSVTADGTIPLLYQWFKDGGSIAGATNSSYTINNATLAEQGSYFAVVRNSLGAATSSNAVLTINCTGTPATITAQPANQVLAGGGTIGLSVDASGAAPIVYQWYRNGSPVPGATNAIYAKTNAQPSETGFYSVLIKNCAGAVSSSDAVVSISEAPYVLMGLTNYVWKYEESGTDLGTAWREVNYDDTQWKTGRGLFAFEDGGIHPVIATLTNTVLALSNSSGTQIPTYYFRTHFTLTNDPSQVMLVTSNYIDDGAVAYLNGVEAFRTNMPAGAVTFNTLAPSFGPPGGEGTFVVTNLPSSKLVIGDNVLAVEVHQVNLVSSDIDFGMQVNVVFLPPAPVQITNQPADILAGEGSIATFAAGVSGSRARYQWYKDGTPIPGATGTSLTISNVTFGELGFYALQASNAFGVVYSRFASLTVVLDYVPPVLVAADALDPTHVLASFSEALHPNTATNPANYLLTNTFGAARSVLSAVVMNQTNVLLTTSALADGANHVLTALGMSDTSVAQNVMPASAVPVARTLRLVDFAHEWFYFDPFPPFSDPDAGPNWNADGHDTSMWGVGRGAFSAFAFNNPNFVPPTPVNTDLGPTPVYASYYRAPFAVAASRAGLGLTLRYAVADGAVFYLNQAEVHRFNMPGGNVIPTTPATGAVTNPVVSAGIEISTDFVRAGSNLLAVELHQVTTNDAEKLLAAELVARAESLLTGPVLVLGGPNDVTVIENQPAAFRVMQIASTLFQWQMNGANVPGATNPVLTFLAPLSLDGAQVQCVCGSANTSIITTNATLRVLPDRTRPELLSAVFNADNRFTLSFSEPLDVGTATNVSNYAVTNASGPAAVVSSAVLTNGTNVLLSFASPLAGNYTVVVNNVTDTAAFANAVEPGSAVSVSADYFIAMDSAWKYLLINTNEIVQSTFMEIGYDDSTWRGPSNALFYVEESALPGLKNTPLMLSDPFGNRINTYYFRQQFVAPVGARNAAFRLQHIIDDGMVLHLNGAEVYRFNLPPGEISAATPGAPPVGNAALLGPFFFDVTNLFGGTNIFAVDVHRSSAAGDTDVVMGVELSIHVSGVRFSPGIESIGARLALTPWGNQFALSWSASGFTLEGANDVTGPWMPLTASSPFFVSRTEATAFFRLRR